MFTLREFARHGPICLDAPSLAFDALEDPEPPLCAASEARAASAHRVQISVALRLEVRVIVDRC
jgi:hypothetical protein